MGYATIWQLHLKYGSYVAAAEAYLSDVMTDEGEREAVEQRLQPHYLILARLSQLDEKLDRLLAKKE